MRKGDWEAGGDWWVSTDEHKLLARKLILFPHLFLNKRYLCRIPPFCIFQYSTLAPHLIREGELGEIGGFWRENRGEAVWVTTYGVAQLMHKEERGDNSWAARFLHIHEPAALVTEVVQQRGYAVDPEGRNDWTYCQDLLRCQRWRFDWKLYSNN